MTSYDYVIVGAGSAGCVLASRLSEDPTVKVLVIEAGGWDRDPMIRLPLGFGLLYGVRRHDWGYDSEPDPELNGRVTAVKRGKVIGGSSSTNAMNFVRGHAADYDRWAANGAEGWSYADVLPYFRKLENFEGGGDDWRGDSGPLRVSRSGWQDPMNEAIFAAALRQGYPSTPDFNGAQQEGFSVQQLSLYKGRRQSAAAAWLQPARKRSNLTIISGALVHQVLFEGKRAVGVRFLRNGTEQSVMASREVILSGGAINSPQLLMLSGVGNPDHLRSHGIATIIEAPGVGQNLLDHPSAGIRYERSEPGPFHRLMRVDRLVPAMARAMLFRSGPAAHIPGGVSGFVRSETERVLPDLQFLYSPTSFDASPWFPGVKKPFPDAFSMRMVLLRPETQGQILLRDSNPQSKPQIQLRAFAHQWELDTLARGIEMLFDLAESSELSRFRGALLLPKERPSTKAAMEHYLRTTAFALDHPSSTCKMGRANDPAAVVDPQLRVIGAEGLRVVDASVMPDLVGGNINACVLMMAERAADLIRGRAS